MTGKWQFWIDRGGTFTDVVAVPPDGDLITVKLLSENPSRYRDAALAGINILMGTMPDARPDVTSIDSVKMGTTVATNALLERNGTATALLITRGFHDALTIAYQNRPDIFALAIQRPDMLYSTVREIDERIDAHGRVLHEPDKQQTCTLLRELYNQGIRSVAIVLMHAYRFPAHEQLIACWARDTGFSQVSVSHVVSPLIKFVSRGDTTVADAYLSPVLRDYVDRFENMLAGTRLQFMQSNGGLIAASAFQGKDAILSGPAGGVVGMARTGRSLGFDKLIGFDMGGTSTDVSHFAGEYERDFNSEIAGTRLRVPVMQIHTVAAGGGSILHFDGNRFRVGPESAGAMPGPACYRNNGPLTVTDCNVMLGRLQAEHFPRVFGPEANLPADTEVVSEKFAQLAGQIRTSLGSDLSNEEIAEGFLTIAVDNMANAIKKISIQRGHDISQYVLSAFGGAGGQHACRVAAALGIQRVLVHAHAGVLSAYGIGLADSRLIQEQSIELPLDEKTVNIVRGACRNMQHELTTKLNNQGIAGEHISHQFNVHARYEGNDTTLLIALTDITSMENEFRRAYERLYGFAPENTAVIIEAVQVECIGHSQVRLPDIESTDPAQTREVERIGYAEMYIDHQRRRVPLFNRQLLAGGDMVHGPALVIEPNSTIVVETGWLALAFADGHLLMTRQQSEGTREEVSGTEADPVRLELFNNLFMSIAEQMGVVLQNTASSVNIKERLDYSCAVFNAAGDLIANAPHIPVHIGSMSDSVAALIEDRNGRMTPGDVYLSNSPYHGGTHLPDLTIIKPIFIQDHDNPVFFVAARGHHADIGGITPGSMPAFSTSINEEGLVFDNFPVVERGAFRTQALLQHLCSGPYPSRNPQQNIADIRAQIAACEKGAQELVSTVNQFGLDIVFAYMGHILAYAEQSVKTLLPTLHDGNFVTALDDGSQIRVQVRIDRHDGTADIDFSGTSPQHSGNLNAPASVCRAAVLYVFRCLLNDDIPLNSGFLRPIRITIPPASMLNPDPPAAVVAGNVETSQLIVDTLMGALDIMAASQGTCNNFTFGNSDHQYYETICGGAGAGPDFDGASAVHTHMTNSRLTDPEILEQRFPVTVEEFRIRPGSGGQGRHHGGDGVIRRLRFHDAMTASIISGRRQVRPFGLKGGKPGACGVNSIDRATGEKEILSGCTQINVGPGDQITIQTPGGGGYGKA